MTSMDERAETQTGLIDVTVTVPLYNEAENIPILYERIRGAMNALGQRWELILVNDGSTDGSAAMLDDLAAKDPQVTVVHFRRNFGQTAAFMAGLDYARGRIIVPMDGDLQNDPADIAKLLAKLDEGYDVVSGWRKDRKDNAMRRNLPSRIANRIISRVSGVPLHDYGCSLKAYRREILEGVKLYGEMHRFVPIYASWNGARVTEMEVTHHPRLHGESKYGLERIIKVVLDLLVVKFLFRYSGKPIYIFGGFGFFSIFLGAITGVWALVLKLFFGEMLNRTYHESQGKSVYRVGHVTRRDHGAG